ncbi:MAG: hypothetical protein U0531_09005 [Dehalococcoidia bacterium]
MPREYRSPVIFCGENPVLTLHRPGGDDAVAAASFWHCTYSAQGEGDLLVIWVDDGAVALTAIYSDNAALARFLTDTLNQHFGDFRGRGFGAMAVTPARFSQQSDSRVYHRVACHAADRIIELEWRDVRDRQLMVATESMVGDKSFDIASVLCPVGQATITVDGARVQGEVRLGQDDAGRPRSSAFLAFAESWVAR